MKKSRIYIFILILAVTISAQAQTKRYINQKSIGGYVSTRIRHISNAGFEEPNLGVEDIVISFTLAKPF